MNNFEIGEKFENYCLEKIFKTYNFSILEKSHPFNGKHFVESNLNPDFKLRCRNSNQAFYIECKFFSKRQESYSINQEQLNRYQKINIPVFYIIGFGNPEKPYKLCLLPLEVIQNEIPKTLINHNLFKGEIKNFNELLNLTKKFPNANNS